MLNEASDEQVEEALNEMVRERSAEIRDGDEELKGHTGIGGFEISDHDFQTITIQLRALGLIVRSLKQRSLRDTDTYWTLTLFGDQVLTTLRAIRKTE
jgi:hypothetical protein